MTKIITLIVLVLSVLSCGVLIDTGKITGAWQLERSEFYVYNEITDTYKVYSGTKSKTPKPDTPLLGSFFFSDSSSLVLTFDSNGELSITDTSDDAIEYIVQKTSGSWEVDTYENTVTVKIDKDTRDTSSDAYGIWSQGITFTNSWPLTDLVSMELLIKQEDTEKSYLDVYKTTLKASYMKGFFKKL